MHPSDEPLSEAAPGHRRLRVVVRGAVQGVGFRPFVYRLATELGLTGWVSNSNQGAVVEVEGPLERLERFLVMLPAEKPAPCCLHSLEPTWLDPSGHGGFSIRPSDRSGEPTALVLPDIVTCSECVREIFDTANRRHLYPFTNCTHCGPRFSILEALPYDRVRTSMRGFTLCEQCQAEYENPVDRRFHAQPNACPICGPHLEFWDRNGRVLASHCQAMTAAVEALRRGSIVAVKGLGGFQLMVTAVCEASVRGLRLLKHREEKPFAVMFPSIDTVGPHCELSPMEARLLTSPEGPIVLLSRKHDVASLQNLHAAVVEAVAPGNPLLGVMLPTTGLHHLLLRGLGFPVVATSGNLGDEPICIDEREALTRLRGMAEFFLVHNRPIVRHVDDSIARVLLGRELVLRRARGYAPWPVGKAFGAGEGSAETAVLAVGAHFKSSVALSVGGRIVTSQHIGDLETEAALDALRRVTIDMQHLHEVRPVVVAADLHPDYLSTQFAERLARGANAIPRLERVQHHYAHVLAGMAENEIESDVLGVAWDGTGFGLDGTVWGGEFLAVTGDGFKRIAHLRTFLLPGGDKAAREPRRSALGVLHEVLGPSWVEREDLAAVRSLRPVERAVYGRMLTCGVNAPITSSAGRLFDAVASLLDLGQFSSYEGQAAMQVEFACDECDAGGGYPMRLVKGDAAQGTGGLGGEAKPWVLDWGPAVQELLSDLAAGQSVRRVAMRFHRGLADGIVAVVREAGLRQVVLTGGCFQNRILLELAVEHLHVAGVQPYWHQRIPPNDGGIAVGQVAAVLRARRPQHTYVPGYSR